MLNCPWSSRSLVGGHGWPVYTRMEFRDATTIRTTEHRILAVGSVGIYHRSPDKRASWLSIQVRKGTYKMGKNKTRDEELQGIVDETSETKPVPGLTPEYKARMDNLMAQAEALPHKTLAMVFVAMAEYFSNSAPLEYLTFYTTIADALRSKAREG